MRNVNASRTGSAAGALFLGALLLLPVSCRRSSQDRGAATVTTGAQTTTTGAEAPGGVRMLMNDDAAMMMANTRCQTESACEIAGSPPAFENPDVCRRAFFPQAYATVRDEDCVSGVNERQLAACLDAIRNQGCADPRTAIDTPAPCKRDQLCTEP